MYGPSDFDPTKYRRQTQEYDAASNPGSRYGQPIALQRSDSRPSSAPRAAWVPASSTSAPPQPDYPVPRPQPYFPQYQQQQPSSAAQSMEFTYRSSVPPHAPAQQPLIPTRSFPVPAPPLRNPDLDLLHAEPLKFTTTTTSGGGRSASVGRGASFSSTATSEFQPPAAPVAVASLTHHLYGQQQPPYQKDPPRPPAQGLAAMDLQRQIQAEILRNTQMAQSPKNSEHPTSIPNFRTNYTNSSGSRSVEHGFLERERERERARPKIAHNSTTETFAKYDINSSSIRSTTTRQGVGGGGSGGGTSQPAELNSAPPPLRAAPRTQPRVSTSTRSSTPPGDDQPLDQFSRGVGGSTGQAPPPPLSTSTAVSQRVAVGGDELSDLRKRLSEKDAQLIESQNHHLRLRAMMQDQRDTYNDELRKREDEIIKFNETVQRQKKAIDELEAELGRVQSGIIDRLTAKEFEISQLKREITSRDERSQTILTENDRLKEQTKNLMRRTEELERQFLQQKESERQSFMISDMSGQNVTKLSLEIADLKQKMAEKERQLDRYQSDVIVLNKMMEDKDNQLEEKTRRIDALRDEITKAVSVQQYKDTVRGLQSRVQEAKSRFDVDIAELKTQLHEKSMECLDLQRQVESSAKPLETEVSRLKEEMSRKDALIQQHTQNYENLLSERERLVMEVRRCQTDAKDLALQLASVSQIQAASSTDEKLQLVQEEVKMLREEVSQRGRHILHIESLHSTASADRDALQEKEQMLSAEVQALRAEVSILQDQATTQTQLQAELKSELENKESEVSDLRSLIESLRAREEIHTAHNQHLMANSTSHSNSDEIHLMRAELQIAAEQIRERDVRLKQAEAEISALQDQLGEDISHQTQNQKHKSFVDQSVYERAQKELACVEDDLRRIIQAHGELQSECVERENRLAVQEQMLEQAKTIQDRLEDTIRSKDKKIDELQSIVSSLQQNKTSSAATQENLRAFASRVSDITAEVRGVLNLLKSGTEPNVSAILGDPSEPAKTSSKEPASTDLNQAVQKLQETVSALRLFITENYAEKVGNECITT